LPPVPVALRIAALLHCGVLLASAIVGAAASVMVSRWDPNQAPIWTMLGFEIIIAAAAIIGLLTGLGRFREGPAMAWTIVAGATLLGSVLGYQAALRNIAGYSLTGPLLGRASLSITLLVIASLTVLIRDRRSMPMAIKGLVLAGPPVALGLAAFVLARGTRAEAWIQSILSLPLALKMVAGGFALVAGGVAFCIGTHLIIRAFELGRLGDSESGNLKAQPQSQS
jgi:hypothetical protein